MAAIITLTKKLATAAAALLAASQVPVSGTALTLTGTQPDTARRVLLTYGVEASARTMVITGTNEGGAAISETLTVPSGGGGTVATAQDFLTITRALPLGSGWSQAVTLGTNGIGSTRWVLFDRHMTSPELGIQLDFPDDVATASIETTMDSPLAPLVIYTGGTSAPPVPIPVAWPGLTGVTGSAGLAVQGDINQPVAAWRLTIVAGIGTVRAIGVPQGLVD